ncbi:MAG: hypothetical protein GY797_23935 [Deltaproteobacteria bacterium]|nr:hypothetical protein [Deltaproteobacteria bacterium]
MIQGLHLEVYRFSRQVGVYSDFWPVFGPIRLKSHRFFPEIYPPDTIQVAFGEGVMRIDKLLFIELEELLVTEMQIEPLFHNQRPNKSLNWKN